jgi:hypothetical protein
MGIGYYTSLVTMQAAGPSLSASTATTSLLNPQAKIILPAGFFAYIGQKLLIRAQGQISNVVTTPGTFQFTIQFGSVVVFDSGQIAQSTTAHTTLPIWFEVDMTLRTIGTGTVPTATVMAQGRATSKVIQDTSQADAASVITHSTLMIPNVTPAVSAVFDSTTTNIIDCLGKFSVSNAGTNITLQQYEVISCNWGG